MARPSTPSQKSSARKSKVTGRGCGGERRYGGERGEKGVSPSDRNLIDLYADGGVGCVGPFTQRPHDKIGLGFAYAQISGRARDLDRDFAAFFNRNRPIRDYEASLTMSYLEEIKQGWTVQPNFQYIIHPGGGAVRSTHSSIPERAKNAAVLAAPLVFGTGLGHSGGDAEA